MAQVRRRGPLANAADDERLVDLLEQLAQERVLRRVGAHHGILDPGHDAGVDKPAHVVRREKVLRLEVDDDAPAEGIGKATDRLLAAVGRCGERLR